MGQGGQAQAEAWSGAKEVEAPRTLLWPSLWRATKVEELWIPQTLAPRARAPVPKRGTSLPSLHFRDEQCGWGGIFWGHRTLMHPSEPRPDLCLAVTLGCLSSPPL